MNLYKGLAILGLLSLAAAAEEAKRLPRFVPVTNRAPDLDFEENDNPDEFPVSQVEERPGNRNWVYWGLGVTAAAGGMTFYFLDLDKPVAPKKRIEVFTDKQD